MLDAARDRRQCETTNDEENKERRDGHAGHARGNREGLQHVQHCGKCERSCTHDYTLGIAWFVVAGRNVRAMGQVDGCRVDERHGEPMARVENAKKWSVLRMNGPEEGRGGVECRSARDCVLVEGGPCQTKEEAETKKGARPRGRAKR